MAQKRIEFQGVDNGLTATMERFRQKAKEISVNMLEDSRNYSKSGREQLRFLEDQIKAQEKRNQLEKTYATSIASLQRNTDKFSGNALQRAGADRKYEGTVGGIDQKAKGEEIMSGLLREQIDTIKMISKTEIQEDRQNIIRNVRAFKRAQRRGDFTGFTPVDIAKRRYQADLLEEDTPSKKDSGAMSAFSGFLGGMMFDKFMGVAAGMPNAQTGLEIIKPMAGLTGALAAGGAAKGFDTLMSLIPFVDNPNLTLPAMRTGQALGEMGADAYIRQETSRDKLQREMHQIQAITGGHANIPGMAGLGLDKIQAAALVKGAITTGGFTRDFGTTAAMEGRAGHLQFGTSEEEINRSMRLMKRTGNESLREGFSRAGAGVELGQMDAHDRVGMNGMYRNINTMTEMLSKNATNVDADSITAMLLSLNAGGGQFAVRDDRSIRNLQTMQEGLVNPQNEFVQAQQFAIARDAAGEDASFVDILKIQQQGLNNMDYVRKVIKTVKGMGGDQSFQTLAIAEMFGLQNNLEAAEQLQGMDMSKVTKEEIAAIRTKGAGSKEFIEEGKEFVTRLEANTAVITNAYIKGMSEGVLTVKNVFIDEMSKAMGELKPVLADMFGVGGVNTLASSAVENTVKEGKHKGQVFKNGRWMSTREAAGGVD